MADESVPVVKFGPPPAGHGYGGAVLADADASPAAAAPATAVATANVATASRQGFTSLAIPGLPIDATSGHWSDPHAITHNLTNQDSPLPRPLRVAPPPRFRLTPEPGRMSARGGDRRITSGPRAPAWRRAGPPGRLTAGSSPARPAGAPGSTSGCRAGPG